MVLLVLALTACGGSSAPSVSDEPKPVQQTTPAPMETAPSAEAPAQQASEGAPAPEPRSETSEVLVVYFSATGTTRGVAEKLAALTGADTYEIIAAEPYSNADLNWNDRNSRTTLEQNDKSVRPGIGSEAIDLSGYTTVYIGYPIWWGRSRESWTPFICSSAAAWRIIYCSESPLPFWTMTRRRGWYFLKIC